MEGNSAILQALGRYGYMVFQELDLLTTYSHLLAAALFPIYIGAHASLRCPSRVATEKVTQIGRHEEDDDDDDDELEPQPIVEGLTPSDAILFPVLAGLTLAGLYYLIKWLKDPALLNKILGWYFSTIGVLGVGRLASDALNVATTFIFPRVWRSGTKLYYVQSSRQKTIASSTEIQGPTAGWTPSQIETDIATPLPGLLSNFPASSSLNGIIWNIRIVFTESWILRAYLHGVTNSKSRVRLNDVIGFFLGLAAIALYNLNGKAWWLTNLMGFGFCYGTLQLMSPTTFWTGSLVLMGLFVYDVVMVFYTPLMVTVATTIDAPIKLIFPGTKRGGMLGLGDVVLPGIMMALALRFDLYMHYLRKQRALHASTQEGNPLPKEVHMTDQKPTYHPATGFYGERYWTSLSMFSLLKSKSKLSSTPDRFDGGNFKKPYFHASVVGYLVGMLVTLFVLNVYNHAQPALLYLVPGVLCSLWGTSVLRGEWKEMWEYSESGVEESSAKDIAAGDEKEVAKHESKGITSTVASGKEEEKNLHVAKKTQEHAHHIFLFSLSSPKGQHKKTGHVE